MDDRISKEQKLATAKDLVASYLKGEGAKNVPPEKIGEVFTQVYNAVDAAIPDPEQRRIGLGL